MGIESQLALRLYGEKTAFGAVNLYSTQPESIGERALGPASVLAADAVAAMEHVSNVDEFAHTLATSRSVRLAMRILMARHGWDENAATEFLVQVSETGNLKLRTVIERVINESATTDTGAARLPD